MTHDILLTEGEKRLFWRPKSSSSFLLLQPPSTEGRQSGLALPVSSGQTSNRKVKQSAGGIKDRRSWSKACQVGLSTHEDKVSWDDQASVISRSLPLLPCCTASSPGFCLTTGSFFRVLNRQNSFCKTYIRLYDSCHIFCCPEWFNISLNFLV